MTPAEINVPSVDYVLGLADVIGEYRRLALDNLREGEVKKGEKCLEIMDQVFIQLLALDEAYMLVPGLRHKSDIARRIIESTRGDITLEVRRKSLEDQLKRFDPVKAHRQAQAQKEELKIASKLSKNFSVKKAHNTQVCLSKKLILEDRLPKKIGTVGGVDVHYVGSFGHWRSNGFGL